MRYIRYAFLAALAVCLITVALANRSFVTLKALPTELANLLGVSATIDLPSFVVIFGGVIAGLLIGFLWEWLREAKIRSEASRAKKQVGKLEREVSRLRGEKHEGKDEVLALLEE